MTLMVKQKFKLFNMRVRYLKYKLLEVVVKFNKLPKVIG